tara:strand:- start:292 stop:453 length:162 start_codon:yes stop_codon:yes gene_type:complete
MATHPSDNFGRNYGLIWVRVGGFKRLTASYSNVVALMLSFYALSEKSCYIGFL